GMTCHGTRLGLFFAPTAQSPHSAAPIPPPPPPPQAIPPPTHPRWPATDAQSPPQTRVSSPVPPRAATRRALCHAPAHGPKTHRASTPPHPIPPPPLPSPSARRCGCPKRTTPPAA